MRKIYTQTLLTLILTFLAGTGYSQLTNYATPPYFTGFESGTLDNNWYTTSSTSGGRIQIWSNNDFAAAQAHTDTMWLGMDASPGGSYVTNEVWMGLDLSTSSGTRLGFWWSEWNDETEPQDGVYISDDGGTTFTKVIDLNGASYTDLTWHYFDISLDSLNAVHNLSNSATYVVKFQQYDNYYFNGGNDGFLFDDINVYLSCTTFGSITANGCNSYTVPSGNQTYYSSGTYHDTLTNSQNCDSIITIDLTLQTSFETVTDLICDASYTSPSGNYTWSTTGTYHDTIPNAAGCDSIITFNLTFDASTTSNVTVTTCNTYTSPSGNHTWTTSGNYQDTLVNAAGCDSLISVDLTVHYTVYDSISVTACTQYTPPSGVVVWTASGVYTDAWTSSDGCDSLIIIDLTILNNTVGNISASTCDSYVSPSGNYVWNTSGMHVDTLTNSIGCDSIVWVNLTVYGEEYTSTTVNACTEYVSPSGMYVWTENGTYFDTVASQYGCDSIIEIDLTVETVDVSVEQEMTELKANATFASFRWLDCNDNYSAVAGATLNTFSSSTGGTFAAEVTQNSCVDTSDCYTIAALSVGTVDGEQFAVYPNPTNGLVTLQFEGLQDNVDVTITNIVGQVVYQQSYGQTDKIDLNINSDAGIYFIEFKTPQYNSELIKVIKN